MFFLVPFFLFLKYSFLFRSFCLFCAVNSERFRSCFFIYIFLHHTDPKGPNISGGVYYVSINLASCFLNAFIIFPGLLNVMVVLFPDLNWSEIIALQASLIKDFIIQIFVSDSNY